MNNQNKIQSISGTLISVRGDDIDTDRIIPARFLKCTVFSELGPHAFEDDRIQLKAKGQLHAFDQPQSQGASILVVNKNFGCGSSREHAPQSLMRWGIKAIIGESFAEIFFGNCVSLGIPCCTLSEEKISEFMDASEAQPKENWTIDLSIPSIEGSKTFPLGLSKGVQNQFLTGTWNPLEALLNNRDSIAKLEKQLPYHFA